MKKFIFIIAIITTSVSCGEKKELSAYEPVVSRYDQLRTEVENELGSVDLVKLMSNPEMGNCVIVWKWG